MTATGTIRRVSRRPDELPPAAVKRLRVAVDRHDREEAAFRAAIVAELEHGSVRQVAKAAGLSPTTVQAWSAAARRS